MAPLPSPSLGSGAESAAAATTTLPDLTLTLGVLLLGSWTNSILLTIEGHQLYTYFHSSTPNSDSRWLKGTIVGLACNDLVSTVGGAYASVWWYCVNQWGREEVLQRQVWGIAGEFFFASLESRQVLGAGAQELPHGLCGISQSL
jgi:ABC-type transport system involved in cytochrome c biogenesis permease subunit